MNDAASTMSVKVPAPCVSTSDQLCTCRTGTTLEVSGSPTASPVLLDLFRLLPEGLQDGADLLRVLRNVVGKDDGLVVGRSGNPIHHHQQRDHADQSGHGAREMQVFQRLHHRREHEAQQNGKEQNRQHRFAVVGEHYNQANAQQRQRPVVLGLYLVFHPAFVAHCFSTGPQFCLTRPELHDLIRRVTGDSEFSSG